MYVYAARDSRHRVYPIGSGVIRAKKREREREREGGGEREREAADVILPPH